MARPMLSPPLSVPDIVASWWADQDPPWCEPVSSRSVDHVRTAAWHRLQTGDRWADRVRTSANTPLQATGWRNTTVVSFKWTAGVHQIPLPEQVWILRNSDDQWFGVDADRGLYYELSALGPTFFAWWRADSVRRLDMSKPWASQRSVAGGGIPIWAMIPRPGELRAGAEGFERALNFVVGGGYSTETVSWLTKSDGGVSGHPLRAGERLRLTASAYDRLYPNCVTADDRSVVWTLRFYGAVVNDRTSATAGHAVRLPVGAQVGVPLHMTDFEVLVS